MMPRGTRHRRGQSPRPCTTQCRCGIGLRSTETSAGTKPKVSLGPVRTTRKGVAEERLNAILVPINVATVSTVVMGARPSPPQQARTHSLRAPPIRHRHAVWPSRAAATPRSRAAKQARGELPQPAAAIVGAIFDRLSAALTIQYERWQCDAALIRLPTRPLGEVQFQESRRNDQGVQHETVSRFGFDRCMLRFFTVRRRGTVARLPDAQCSQNTSRKTESFRANSTNFGW